MESRMGRLWFAPRTEGSAFGCSMSRRRGPNFAPSNATKKQLMTVFRQSIPAILGWLLASASHAFPQDYLDPTLCRPCHQRLYDEYLAPPMASSFYSVGAKALPEDWSVNNRFDHAPSASHFEMLRRGDNLVIRRYQLDENARQVNSFELPVTHVMGSGIRARSYLHQTLEG